MNNEDVRVADIPVEDGDIQIKKEPNAEMLPPLMLKREEAKAANQHVKTPDEVDDLPEHEIASEQIACSILDTEDNQLSKEFEMEEKIALDLQEKERQRQKRSYEQKVVGCSKKGGKRETRRTREKTQRGEKKNP